jgi:hypothetical protein
MMRAERDTGIAEVTWLAQIDDYVAKNVISRHNFRDRIRRPRQNLALTHGRVSSMAARESSRAPLRKCRGKVIMSPKTRFAT